VTEHDERHDAIGGGLWVAGSVLVPNVFTIVLSVAADRSLGAGGLGRQSLIAFVSGSATTLAGAGGFVAIVRTVAAALGSGDRAAARDVGRWGARLHMITGVVAGAVVAMPALWGAQPRVAWMLAAAVTVLATLQMVPMAVLVGAQRWRSNGVGLITGAAGVAASVVVLRAGGGIEGLFAVELVAVAVNLCWVGALARRALAGPAAASSRTPAQQAAPPLRFAALSALGIVVTVVVWRRSELVMLAWLSSDEEVARYSVAFAVSAILLTLSERFAAALTSPFSSLVSAGDRARLQAARTRAVRLLVVATLPAVGCAAALGPVAIRVLYGDEYARSEAVLLLMLTTMVGLPLLTVSSAVLAAHGDARSPLFAGLAAAAVDVALSIPLIRAHGALGAAAASVVGQTAVIALMHAMARRRAGAMAWDIGTMLRALGVAAGAGLAARCVVAVVSGAPGLAAGVVTAGVGVIVFARLARPLTSADAAWLTRSEHRRAATAVLLWVARADRAGGQSEPAEPATSA
jgi:O-antigen/teichoic acid export membrane protein